MFYDAPIADDSRLRQAEELAVCTNCGGGGGLYRFGLCWGCTEAAEADFAADQRIIRETTAARVAEILDDL